MIIFVRLWSAFNSVDKKSIKDLDEHVPGFCIIFPVYSHPVGMFLSETLISFSPTINWGQFWFNDKDELPNISPDENGIFSPWVPRIKILGL